MQAVGFAALCGLAVTVTSLLYLHLAPTGLSPVRDPVSEYGITRFRLGYRVAAVSFGTAGILLASGIALKVSDPGVVVALLVVFGVARLAIGWFPMDPPGSGRTSTGSAHFFLAFVAFVALPVAALDLGIRLSKVAVWHSLSGASSALAYAMLAVLALMGWSRSLHNCATGSERSNGSFTC